MANAIPAQEHRFFRWSYREWPQGGEGKESPLYL
jgi:hypothetical protein